MNAQRSNLLKFALVFYAISTLVSMAAMSIGTGLLLIILLWQKLSGISQSTWLTELKRPPVQLYSIISLGLCASVFASLLVALIWPLSYGGHSVHPAFFTALSKCWYLFWPILIATGLRTLSPQDQKQILNLWLGAFALLCLVGILQYFWGWPRPQPIPGSTRFHATLFLGHHLSVASIWIFPAFIALDHAWLEKKIGSRCIYASIALLGFIVLICTYSRTAWVAVPIGLGAWMLQRLPKKWAFACLIGLALMCSAALQLPQIAHRVHDALGMSERQDLWEANWEFFKHRPLTGVGLKQNQELSGYYLMEKHHTQDVFSGHAHNNVLDLLGGTGLLGLLTWMSWCVIVIVLLYRKGGTILSAGIASAWLVFHLNGLTQVNFWEGKVQHQLAWIIAWSLL